MKTETARREVQDYTALIKSTDVVGTYRVPVIDLRTGESMGTYRQPVCLLDRTVEEQP